VWPRFCFFALLGLAGGCGTLARYGLDGFVQHFISDDRRSLFPWGIITVNLLGCLIFGILVSTCEGRWPVSGETRTVMLTGFLGGFTTFSTYIFEWTGMLQDKEWLPALGNFTLHNVGGLVAMVAGLLLGRLL
jgi:fluoride exporter